MGAKNTTGPMITFTSGVRTSAPLGVDFVERQLVKFDTRRLRFFVEARVSATGQSSSTFREPSRRPVEVDVRLFTSLPQSIEISLPTISNDGKAWFCNTDPLVAAAIASPEAQLTLDATSAIFRAKEVERAQAFARAHLPRQLNIIYLQTRDGIGKEWFERTYVDMLCTLDEALVAHSAWGLFTWLRKTKQVPGRRGMTGASMFVENWLARFRAERVLAALREWNEIK